MENLMKTAVVIPVKNEIAGLEELVESLLKQVSGDDEIIFVDAGSTDGTLEVLKEYSEEHGSLRLIESPGAFPGKARNTAIQNTDAEIIVQIDGGSLPDRMWLEKIRKPLLKGDVDYVVGNVRIMPIAKNIMGISINVGDIYGSSLSREGRDESCICGGASVAYRRWVWEKVGGFPQWAPTGEDVLFSKKVMNINVKHIFVRDAYIYWQIGPGLADIIKRQIYYQAVDLIIPKNIHENKGTMFMPFLILTAIILSFFVPYFWLFSMTIILMQWMRQNLMTLKVYRQRTEEELSGQGRLLALGIIAVIEFINIFSRIAGVVSGTMNLKKRKQLINKINSYLYDG